MNNMSIFDLILEKEKDILNDMPSTTIDDSISLTDSPIKLDDSEFIVDDSDVDSSKLGDYSDFDKLELEYFKDKALIPADKMDKNSVQWNWDDEHLDNYVVIIKKRNWLGSDGDYVYEIIQVGDAELANKDNPYLGVDRDVYSVPFISSSFDFIHGVVTAIGLFG